LLRPLPPGHDGDRQRIMELFGEPDLHPMVQFVFVKDFHLHDEKSLYEVIEPAWQLLEVIEHTACKHQDQPARQERVLPELGKIHPWRSPKLRLSQVPPHFDTACPESASCLMTWPEPEGFALDRIGKELSATQRSGELLWTRR